MMLFSWMRMLGSHKKNDVFKVLSGSREKCNDDDDSNEQDNIMSVGSVIQLDIN